jgi:hypothetical protein
MQATGLTPRSPDFTTNGSQPDLDLPGVRVFSDATRTRRTADDRPSNGRPVRGLNAC